MDLTRPRHVKVSSSLVFLVIWLNVVSGLISQHAQKPCWADEPSLKGVWAPVEGQIGQLGVSHLSIGGEGALYAIGSGEIWRYDQSNTLNSNENDQWLSYGRYAPILTWDEGIGVNASGPFSFALLSEVERQVGGSIEAALEGQGDEDWITEDAALSIIESFEAESSPAIDSPYRVNAVFPQSEGVWVATGAGLWATHHSKIAIPIPESPSPTMSVIQLQNELWVSTTEGIFQSQEYLKYAKSVATESVTEPILKWWRSRSIFDHALLFNYRNQGYAFASGVLRNLFSQDKKSSQIIPANTYALTTHSSLGSIAESLWAMTPNGLWVTKTEPGTPLSWKQCVSFNKPMTHFKVNDAGIVVISPERILFISIDCQRVKDFRPPLSEGVIFMDAEWWQGKLYGATSGGVFVWEDESNMSLSKVGLRYLKRDLALFPRFFQVYQAALTEQGLDPRQGGYGARPVLSALLPQVTVRYSTQPSRLDQRPSMFLERFGLPLGSRQLTLLQPKPEYSLFLEWRISLDFLSAFIDPELGSAYFEAQSQLQILDSDPLTNESISPEGELFDTSNTDTFTSQAQRLAMTTLALERRQKHRDRAQLRTQVARLHRERMKMTYKRWLRGESISDLQRAMHQLRLREIDARLDAITGYRLHIQDRMNPAL